jgi:hypothetical protein
VFGTVGFGLQDRTRFKGYIGLFEVDAYIGATDDNFDFESSNAVIESLEGAVFRAFGPGYGGEGRLR